MNKRQRKKHLKKTAKTWGKFFAIDITAFAKSSKVCAMALRKLARAQEEACISMKKIRPIYGRSPMADFIT